MKECLGSLRRMMGLNTSVNTESKDQKMIKILSDINKNFTLLNGRIVSLEDDKIQSRDRIIVLEDRIIVLEEENFLYKDQLNVVEENIKMLNDVCLEPIIRNVAVQIMNHFFPTQLFPPSGRFARASSKNANIPILNIVMGQLSCNPADIDALINIRNRDSHLNIVDLKEKVDYVRIIIGNSPKFSDDLRLPLDIIANYELFVIHFGNLKI